MNYEARVHNDGKRITIVSAEMWSTFELKVVEDGLNVPTTWDYQVDTAGSSVQQVKNFSIVDKKIRGELSDEHGEW